MLLINGTQAVYSVTEPLTVSSSRRPLLVKEPDFEAIVKRFEGISMRSSQ